MEVYFINSRERKREARISRQALIWSLHCNRDVAIVTALSHTHTHTHVGAESDALQ